MGAAAKLRSGTALTAVLLARIYLGLVVGLVAWSLLPLVLQWQPTVAMSGSMTPSIRAGDVLVAQPLTLETVDKEALRIGQVPLAQNPPNPDQLITHRVVGYAEDGYITRGDANAQPDTAVLPPENVVGIERLRIPFIGLPVHGLRTGDWVPVLVFTVLTVGAQLIVLHDAKAQRRRRAGSADDGENHSRPDDDGDAGLGILEPASAASAGSSPAGAAAASAPGPGSAGSAPDPASSGPRSPANAFSAAIATSKKVPSSATAHRRRALTAAPALGILISGMVISGSTANFSAITFNAGNTLTANADFGPSEYSTSVGAADPWAHYRLDDPAGTGAADSSGNGRRGTYTGASATTDQGALLRETNYALGLGGSAGTAESRSMYIDATVPEAGPAEYSTELWFKTTSTTGGALITFGNVTRGLSTQYDRHIYMEDNGALRFGVYAPSIDPAVSGSYLTVTSAGTYNDGQWHHVAATMGPAGMDLYVDGAVFVDAAATLDGTNDNTQSQSRTSGVWRLGGDSLNGWPGATTADFFTGAIDELAIYPRALTADEVSAHVRLGRSGNAAYGTTVLDDRPSHYFRFEETGGPNAYNSVPGKAAAVHRTADLQYAEPGILTARNNNARIFGAAGTTMTSAALGTHPDVFTTEVWFQTTTRSGGWIMGLGQDPDGLSGQYDRMVYMTDAGNLVFGIFREDLERQYQMLTSGGTSYNDGLWHLVTTTLSPAGMFLYIDGALIDSNTAITSAQPGSGGYWRLGYDNLNSWPNRPGSYEFEGTLDEFAVFTTALSPDQIRARYAAA